MRISEFVEYRNSEKRLFTPGPASLLQENILGLRSGFGRNDSDYKQVEDSVLNAIRAISGQSSVVALQGSATLALEIACCNFLYGNVILVKSGFYSERLHKLAETAAKLTGAINKVDIVSWNQLADVSGEYDWVLGCSTETSVALKIDISKFRQLANQTGGKILLDATASIGLENGHELCDVVCFSSCKGLLGFSGASFICFNSEPQVQVASFYLDLGTHRYRRVTPPIHSICSLAHVLPDHQSFRSAVVENKNRFLTLFRDEIFYADPNMQPLLCTRTRSRINSVEAHAVTYVSRSDISGSIVCHLGEVHLKEKAIGKIFDCLEVM